MGSDHGVLGSNRRVSGSDHRVAGSGRRVPGSDDRVVGTDCVDFSCGWVQPYGAADPDRSGLWVPARRDRWDIWARRDIRDL